MPFVPEGVSTVRNLPRELPQAMRARIDELQREVEVLRRQVQIIVRVINAEQIKSGSIGVDPEILKSQ